MFSDRARVWKILFSIAGLVALGMHYTHFAMNQTEGYRAAVRSPNQHDGQDLLFPLWQVTDVRDASVYEISKTVTGVAVVGSSEGLEVGDTVTIRGRFRSVDLAVVAEERIDHPHRKAKGVLSIIGLFICALLLPRFFELSANGMVVRG